MLTAPKRGPCLADLVAMGEAAADVRPDVGSLHPVAGGYKTGLCTEERLMSEVSGLGANHYQSVNLCPAVRIGSGDSLNDKFFLSETNNNFLLEISQVKETVPVQSASKEAVCPEATGPSGASFSLSESSSTSMMMLGGAAISSSSYYYYL